MISLSQKEQMLLQDQKSHEELCIKKYNACAQQAKDPVLQELFSSLAREEEQHLDTINQILGGKVPNMSSSSNSSSSSSSQTSLYSSSQSGISAGTSTSSSLEGQFSSQNDKDLCSDLLATEKYVSSAYDTTIFECTDSRVRDVLNHIQKEEQEHGKALFDYMNQNGMYNVK